MVFTALKKGTNFFGSFTIFKQPKSCLVQFVQVLKKWILQDLHVGNVENFLRFSAPS